MKLFKVRCFITAEKDSGNPAGIILNSQLKQHEKQIIAKELNLPVITFINTTIEPYLFEFFYPQKQARLCLHGSLGAAAVLFKNQMQLNQFIMQTNEGLRYKIKQEKELMSVEVSGQFFPEISIDCAEIMHLLKVSKAMLGSNPISVKSVGSPKLLISLTSKEKLDQLEPDFFAIKEWSIKHKVNGIYAYVLETDGIYARNFNPLSGQNEDTATGVAAGALALELKKNLLICQGKNLKRESLIYVNYNSPQSIWVGGRVCYNEIQ